MKVMVMVKATPDSEAGKMPSAELIESMTNFNERLVDAGVMEAGEGLKPSSEGVRVRFSGKDRSVTRGPFIETNELVAGYWIWNVETMEEAIEWVRQCPNPMEEDSDIDIRPMYSMDDFADVDPDGVLGAREDGLRNTLEMRQAKVATYLFFGGQCEEAVNYYQHHLGAKVQMMLKFSESPEPLPEGSIPEGFDDKVMHCAFTLGNATLLASDGCAPGTARSGFSQSITVDDASAARRIFAALADGGEINMPLSETFWSPLYGQVTDKFGVSWMVMVAGPEQDNHQELS